MSDFRVAVAKLNLRKLAESGDVLAVLPRGQVVSGIGEPSANGWLNVRTSLPHVDDEMRGFVAARYLEPVSVPQLAPTDAMPTAPSAEQLGQLVGGGRAAILAAVASGLDGPGVDVGLFIAPLRMAHFLAQAAHESDGFRTTVEYWGPTAQQRGYEGRSDLGNTQPGDGRRYMGRGIFQLTGRDNYARYGQKLGLDLVNQPELAAEPPISFRIACHYWLAKGLNALADKDDLVGITRRINGGENGLADRQRYYLRARALWG